MINDLYRKIGTILNDWGKNRASKVGDIKFNPNDSEGDRFIGFSTPVIEKILPPLEGCRSKWKKGVYILYFIDSKFVHETGVDTVNISCVINNIGLSKSEKEFCEFLITEAGHDIKENWVTKKLKTWNVRKCKENENLKTIEDDINKTLNDILENDIRSFEKEFFKPILEKMNVEFDLNKEDNDLQSVVIENGDFEGKTIKYYTTKYERSMKNRRDAISAHGTKCMVCGFDFKSCYGELGEGFIEVHHIKPLFDLQEEIRVNPSTDLVCLCSNCHSMIHRKKGYMFSIKELKELLQDNKKGR